MSDEPKNRPSFSTASRWRFGFDVVLRTVLVIAVAGMVNYLGARFYHRFHLSRQAQAGLASRTLSVLHSLTNRVDITLYYDRQANFYPDVVALLKEYGAASKNIAIQTVDYNRDPGQAQLIKAKYQKYFTTQADKDLVIFDCGGRVRVFPGDSLTQYRTVQVAPTDPKQKLEFERRPVAFNGEQAFTSILLTLANPQPLKAYFLQGHGERSLTETGNDGYQTFLDVLGQNYISVTNLAGPGNTGVPLDCNLLVIAGPTTPLKELEAQQIAQYLREGGRLLVMFDFRSQAQPTGLEAILRSWGVAVVSDTVQDPHHTESTHDVIVSAFNHHPVVDSIAQLEMQLYSPCPVLPMPPSSQAANGPEVTWLFAASPEATLLQNSAESPHAYTLACAVEQKPVAGITNPRGNTRIVAVGDDIFLGNYLINGGGNRDFLSAALNWLCDRPLLIAGIGPHPVTNLRLEVSRQQQRQLSWLLLGALPGVVLVIGWLVWLVRRR
jgi:ABC-type uncharacterized transport system involved in gliding motility auxiliary subunit